jgi:hypothetical protein
MDLFDNLPVSAIINNKFLCIHGGISAEFTTVRLAYPAFVDREDRQGEGDSQIRAFLRPDVGRPGGQRHGEAGWSDEAQRGAGVLLLLRLRTSQGLPAEELAALHHQGA